MAVCVVLALLAGCSRDTDPRPNPPTATSSPCPPPTATAPPDLNELLRALGCTDVIDAARSTPTGDVIVRFDEIVRLYTIGWQDYFAATGYQTLQGVPSDVGVLAPEARDGIDLRTICQGVRRGETTSPLYCRSKPQQQGSVDPALIVLPEGFLGRVQKLQKDHGDRQALISLAVVLAVQYAKHVRFELEAAGLPLEWPGADLDSCLAGMSLRRLVAMPPEPTVGELRDALEFAGVTPAQELAGPLTAGYSSGALSSCL